MNSVLPISAVEYITPEIAQNYLSNNSTNQRPLDRNRVKYYAEQIKDGKWQLNGECITFDSNGRLTNGQHRLHAIIAAKKGVQTFVIRGISTDAYKTQDFGKPRSNADILKINKIPNEKTVASYMNAYFSLRKYGYGEASKLTVGLTPDICIDEYNNNKELYDEVVSITNKGNKEFKAIKKYMIGGITILLVKDLNYPKEKVFNWLSELYSGHTQNQSILDLRNKLINDALSSKKIQTREVYKYYAKCWYNYFFNKHTKKLRVGVSDVEANFLPNKLNTIF